MSCGIKHTSEDWGGISPRWSHHGGGGGGGGKCKCQRKLTMMLWAIIALVLAVIALQMKQMRML